MITKTEIKEIMNSTISSTSSRQIRNQLKKKRPSNKKTFNYPSKNQIIEIVTKTISIKQLLQHLNTEESFYCNKKLKMGTIELPFILKFDNPDDYIDFKLLKLYNESILNSGSYTIINEPNRIIYGSVGGHICNIHDTNNKAWSQIYKVFEIFKKQLGSIPITVYRNFINREISSLNAFVDPCLWLKNKMTVTQINYFHKYVRKLKIIISHLKNYHNINYLPNCKKKDILKEWSTIVMPNLVRLSKNFKILDLDYDLFVCKIRSLHFGITFVNHLELILGFENIVNQKQKPELQHDVCYNNNNLQKKKILTSFLNYFLEDDPIMQELSLYKFSNRPLKIFENNSSKSVIRLK